MFTTIHFKNKSVIQSANAFLFEGGEFLRKEAWKFVDSSTKRIINCKCHVKQMKYSKLNETTFCSTLCLHLLILKKAP